MKHFNVHDLLILAGTATGLGIEDINNIMQALTLLATSIYTLIRILKESKQKSKEAEETNEPKNEDQKP